jgi:hypothetical protein
MITRRTFGLIGLVIPAFVVTSPGRAESNEMFVVRIRGDETIRGVLPPIALRQVTITPDNSAAAKALASRAPPDRAAPLILVIVGAVALVHILEMIKELTRQYYYGGVMIDCTKSPPEISNNQKIPANMVFVLQRDGNIKQVKSDDVSTKLLASVLRVK